MKSRVLLLKSDESLAYSRINEVFGFFPQSFQRKVRKIAIKLNICAIKPPETGATSHPAVVEGLLKVLREKYGDEPEINIVESDGANNRGASYAFKLLGFQELAKKYGASCVNLSKDSVVKKKIDGYIFKEYAVPKTLVESDLFISVPKLKTHHMVKITCGLKNQFGCLREKDKAQFHGNLDKAIVDSNLLRRPDFVLVDGVLGMVGAGTFFGLTKRFNLLVASNDVVAADCVCSRILGFNPYFVGHIRRAAAKGVGSMNYEVYGVRPETVRVENDFDKTTFYFEKLYRSLKRARGPFAAGG